MEFKSIALITVAISIHLVADTAQCLWSEASSVLPLKQQDDVYQKFTSLLIETRSKAPDDRIAALRSFLQNHPSFQRVYHVLLENYLYHNRLNEAKAYFRNLSDKPSFSRNSYWMQAKIAIYENERSTAFDYFEKAFLLNEPSIALLKDFIEFDHRQPSKLKSDTLLHRLRLDFEIRKIVLALYKYYDLDYQDADSLFEHASTPLVQNPVTLNIWGECAYRASKQAKADSLWRLGHKLSQQRGDLHSTAMFLSNLGLMNQILRSHELALSFHDSAYAIANRIGDYTRIQKVTTNRAFILRRLGKFADAEKQFKEALETALSFRDQISLADLYMGYGYTLYVQGEFAEALKALNRGEEHARRAKNDLQLIKLKREKAKIYISLKQLELAQNSLEDALKISTIHHLTRYEKLSKAKLGDVMLLKKEYVKARSYYNEYIDYLNSPKKAYWWIGRLAKSYLLERDYTTAKAIYLKALQAAKEAGSKTFEGWFELRLGDIEVRLENIEEAKRRYHSALTIANRQKSTEMLWEAHFGIGNAHQHAGELEAAISAYTHAAHFIEQTRNKLNVDQLRIGHFVEGHRVYEELVDCYLQRYESNNNPIYLDSLFYYVSMSRGRTIQELNRYDAVNIDRESGRFKKYQQVSEALRALQRQLRRSVDQFHSDREIDSLRTELESVRMSLLEQRLRILEEATRPESRKRSQRISLPKILDRLKKVGSGLVLYYLSEDTSFALVAADDEAKIVGLSVKPLLLASAIDSLLSPFHRAKKDSIRFVQFNASIAHNLYRTLIKTIEEVFSLPERLIIVPDLELMNLPFEMLLTKPPARANYTPLDMPIYADHFLIQQYAITYSPNPFLLQQIEAPDFSQFDMVVFANPFYKEGRQDLSQNRLRSSLGWRFDPLPSSEIEAKKIEALHTKTKTYTRRHATKAAVIEEAAEHQIVHFATHAFVDMTFEAFSGLAMAASSDSSDDGLLMGYEISDLSLNCDLISLSACETGRGKLVAGEGVLGLPRLFLGAGAKSVLMTLWKVDDKFASLLTPRFYDLYINHRQSKAEALSAAKRTILNDRNVSGESYYQHPFYWASFTLYGDPGVQRPTAPNRVIIAIGAGILVILVIVGLFFLKQVNAKKKMALG